MVVTEQPQVVFGCVVLRRSWSPRSIKSFGQISDFLGSATVPVRAAFAAQKSI